MNKQGNNLDALQGQTVIVTGGATGIGLEIVRKYHSKGANVVIVDLASSQDAAEVAMDNLGDKARSLFVPANVISWQDMSQMFTRAIHVFGRVDIVVANAGIMENRRFFDFEIGEKGQLLEDGNTSRVVDVNLKGAMNTLRLAVFHMEKNQPDIDNHRGSVILVASTSGYIGGTQVVSYVSSKHGVIGLLRSANGEAARRGIRLNAIAPFVTPTTMTGSYSDLWKSHGMPTNSPAGVAAAVVRMGSDTKQKGGCLLVVGDASHEIEGGYKSSMSAWVGESIFETFLKAGDFFRSIGGYPLPQPRSE